MLRTLIAIYRANPIRPHCNSAAGIHTWLCRIAAPFIGPECDPPSPP